MSYDRAYPPYLNLGNISVATQVQTSGENPHRARVVVWFLSATVALVMSGFGLVLPVFARRLDELGSGVEALSMMTMSFTLAALFAAPLMGVLADRAGRRPLILISLAMFVLVNLGYLIATSSLAFIAMRAVQGVGTATLLPAAMGMVADISPVNARARWVGILMGSMSSGFVFGPVIGGALYDAWGTSVPFITSAAMGFLGLVAATLLISETRTQEFRRRQLLRLIRVSERAKNQSNPVWSSLPRPLYTFGILLAIDFIIAFAFTFVEPQMVFYFYNGLGWTSVQFGLVVATYGLTMVFGQTLLGQASDRFGRRPMISIGLLLTSALYLGLAFTSSFPLMVVCSLVSGLGVALTMPALSASYLDITPDQHRSRAMGIKESFAQFGGVTGPLVLVICGTWMGPQSVFVTSAALVLVLAGLAFVALTPRHAAGRLQLASVENADQATTARTTLRRNIGRAEVARVAGLAA